MGPGAGEAPVLCELGLHRAGHDPCAVEQGGAEPGVLLEEPGRLFLRHCECPPAEEREDAGEHQGGREDAGGEEIKGLKRQVAELSRTAEKKPKAQPKAQQPPAYRQVSWEGQQATAKAMGPRPFADDGSVKEPQAQPATEAKEEVKDEPQQEPPAEPRSPNKMGQRASCWSESHGDVSGYLKSGLLGSQQSITFCSPKFLKLA